MKIEIKSPIVTEKIKNQNYIINYGTIKKGSKTNIEFIFTDCVYHTHTKTCGCTHPSITITNDGFDLSVSYDSNKVGTINQSTTITTDKGKVKIELKGLVQ